MGEESRQLFVGAFLHPFAKQLLHFSNCWIVRQSWIEHAPDAALACFLPAFDPIAHIDGAVEAELDVRAEKAADKFLFVERFEARAFRTQPERIDKAVWTTAKIAE